MAGSQEYLTKLVTHCERQEGETRTASVTRLSETLSDCIDREKEAGERVRLLARIQGVLQASQGEDGLSVGEKKIVKKAIGEKLEELGIDLESLNS